MDYFQGIKGVKAIQAGINPATWMLEVSRAAEERRLRLDFGAEYLHSDLHKYDASF